MERLVTTGNLNIRLPISNTFFAIGIYISFIERINERTVS